MSRSKLEAPKHRRLVGLVGNPVGFRVAGGAVIFAPPSSQKSKRPLLTSGQIGNDVGKRPHDSREARGLVDPLRLEFENMVLRRRLELLTRSPGWRLNRSYRRWLRSSRIGQALRRPLAWLQQRAAGSSDGPTPASAMDYESRIINDSILHESLSGGNVVVVCEYPSAESLLPCVGIIHISGWAVAKNGVVSVTATLDGKQPLPIDFGRRRPDIGMHLSDYAGSSDAGFRIELDCTQFSKGDHQLSIVVRTTDHEQATLNRPIKIGQGSPYSVWIHDHAARSRQKNLATERPTGSTAEPQILIVMHLSAFRPRDLRAQIESVLKQTYANWRLVLWLPAAAGDDAAATAESYAKSDSRITIGSPNHGPLGARHCVDAILPTDCELLAVVSGSTLDPHALSELTAAFKLSPSLGVAYADEDQLLDDGTRETPFFKPQYSPELLRGFNYIGKFFLVRREVIEKLANIHESPDIDPIYDLILRLSEITSDFERVAKVLSHRIVSQNQDPSSPDSLQKPPNCSRRAIETHLKRTATPALVEPLSQSSFRVRYLLDSDPEVQIVIPSGGQVERLKIAIESVLQRTEYSNFTILIADNSYGTEIAELASSFATDHRVAIEDYRSFPFNFSRLCNQAAERSSAPVLLFLNDDVEVINETWLRSMVEHAMRKEIGAVGARLRFPDGTLQHAGVVIGIGGLVGCAFRGLKDGNNGHIDLSATTRNWAAVSAACLMTRREVFQELGGFDEANLQISLQEVDYCLRGLEKGYRTVYDPHAELTHYESTSREQAGLLTHPDENRYFRERWAGWINDDPYYNPNLTRSQDNFAIRLGE